MSRSGFESLHREPPPAAPDHVATVHRFAIVAEVFHPYAWSCSCGVVVGCADVFAAEALAFAHVFAQRHKARTAEAVLEVISRKGKP